MHVSLLIEDDKWLSLLGADAESQVQKVCSLALARAPALEVLLPGEREQLGQSVVLANDASIRSLNLQYREKDAPTNVLSFPAHETVAELKAAMAMPMDGPLAEDASYIGDIILARETIEREAKEQEKTFSDHFMHLLVHGTLHLLGYDHMDDAEAEEMETLEIAILKELSIANPYD